MHLQPNISIRHCHSVDSNQRPQSVVTEDGTLNLDIQQLMKAWATVSAVMSGIGIASGYLINMSIHVSR